ncbi:MAG: ATP-dependent DNA helicase RecG [Candidatus Moranbacteria bacterium]|nr:ATP-dependent DNA helicase RecG [Candidatus Moranbacteria bacterium]
MDIFNAKIQSIPRISEKYAEILKKINVETVGDFLFHFPFRYEDYSERIEIDALVVGQTATIMGEISQSKLVRTWKKKMLITECHISDETGTVRAVWFNQPYVSDSLIVGKGVRLSGKVLEDKNGMYFSNPAWELSSREPTNTGRLVPIYSETEGLTSKWLRWQMQNIFKLKWEIQDPIPRDILEELHLPNIRTALEYIHFPQTENQYLLAQKRFAFQNMLTIQLASLRAKMNWEKEFSVKIPFQEKTIQQFTASLPFTLTNAQRKASFEILKDLEKPKPMNRLLNGDVGSGKTIVAALASLQTAEAGFQTAIMAPTEVLARQHFENISKLFADYDISIGLLTNAYQEASNLKFKNSNLKLKAKIQNTKLKRAEMIAEIEEGRINILIGTHALIQKDVRFKNLALVIIDEQHRFGVNQRAYLQKEITAINDGLPGKIPHLLTMTATPIPRTLTMAYFGNLDLSLLDEMPKNRKPIITKIILPSKRNEVYDFVRNEVAKGYQAFIIFPLVEESEKLAELKAATAEHKKLSRDVFSELSLGLLHGKLKAKEKERVMADFKNKKYDILVATSVVEVGIDIPNATVIMIEDSDRFGLSQLHQFRGRVGRSELQSYCFLLTSNSTVKSKSRLVSMEKTNSGFEIAEADLKLRGPGEFLGLRQSGLPDIAMEHLGNVKLIEISRQKALMLLKDSPVLSKYPLLKKELEKFATNVHLE